MTKLTAEHKDSTTAAYVCFARACAARERDERFRGPDWMAEAVFIPRRYKFVVQVPPLRRFVMGKTSGMYEYVMARTRVLDAIFKQALVNCFPQIVVLGAGFDTRALRFASLNRGTRIIELDDASTQQPKREILARKKVPLPRELVFAPIDFNSQSLREVLAAAGYRENQLTLFLWEGVTMYLDAEAVDETLALIHASAAKASLLAFDAIYGSVLRRENRYAGEKEVFERVARAGEGWTFGVDEGAMPGFLAERGFEIVAFYTASDLEKAYLTAEDGSLHGHVNGTHCLVVAKTV